MSIFSYNGVSMALIRTRLFRVEPEYDQSGTDHLWNKFTISVVGMLGPTQVAAQAPYTEASMSTNPDTVAEMTTGLGLEAALARANAMAAANAAVVAAKASRSDPSYVFTQINPASDPTGFLNAVQNEMTIPRRTLFYQCGGLVVKSAGVDAHLGPKPVSCEVVNMLNGYFLVNFTVTVCLAGCAANPLPPAVVSLKWVQSESFDENWLSTITTRGKLIVRSDLKQSADSFRNLCVPGALSDYRRTHIDWTPNESGTELGFSVTDRENYLNPPYGATTAKGRFTVVLALGAKRTGQCDVGLTGAPGGNRADLLAIATRMCMSKLESEGLASPATPVHSGSFSEELFENSVSVSLQCLLQPIRKTTDRGAIRTAGNTPFVSKGQLPLAPPVRSRLIALLSPAFYDPCSTFGGQLVSGGSSGMQPNNAVLTSSGAANTPVGPTSYATTYGPPTLTITVVDEVVDPSQGFDSINLTDPPYDEYHCDMAYSYDSGRVMLPGTGVGPYGGIAAVAQMHGGIMYLDCTWHAVRKTLPPVLPRFESPNSNFVAINGVVTPVIEMNADQQSPIYTVSGHYKYGVLNPAAASAAAAIPPFLTAVAAQASPLAAGFFSDAILWTFQGAGPNPFSPSLVVGQLPGAAVANALGAFLAVAGIPVPPPFTTPPTGDIGGGGDF